MCEHGQLQNTPSPSKRVAWTRSRHACPPPSPPLHISRQAPLQALRLQLLQLHLQPNFCAYRVKLSATLVQRLTHHLRAGIARVFKNVIAQYGWLGTGLSATHVLLSSGSLTACNMAGAARRAGTHAHAAVAAVTLVSKVWRRCKHILQQDSAGRVVQVRAWGLSCGARGVWSEGATLQHVHGAQLTLPGRNTHRCVHFPQWPK